MWRRLGISVLLAALCMGVLATRVYEDFERVRVRLITAPRVAEGSAVTIALAGQTGRLTGQSVAVILRVQGPSEPTDVAISLDGRRLARATVPANRTIRVDTAIELLQPSAEQITVTASRSGWAVTYLELATVHGFSSGPVSLVVVPRSRPLDRLVPTWSLLPLLAALIALRPRPEWPRGRLRVLHRAGVGLVLVLFAASLLAHVFTPYAVLLALPTFFLCAAVLYAEPLSRAWPFLRQAFLESVRSWEAAGPATERIPRWVTALDVACLIVLALLVRSMTDDDYRISLKPGLSLSLSSWPRLALWLTALLTLRYLTWRAIPWHVRVVVWLRALWRSEPLRRALPPFITSRLVVLMIGFLAVATIGFETPPVWRALDNDFLDLYGRWDSGWYYFIARNGYSGHFNPARASEIAFFPGLPLLMRGVGILAHVNFWIAGILVVVVTFLWGLTYVYRLALQDLPADQARASLMFLAFYPFAVCYSAVLTESLFLLAAAAAFYHFRRSELWKAGVFGLLAGLLRPNGCLLSVPLALLALIPFARDRGWWLPGRPAPAAGRWPALLRQLTAASLPVVGMLAYAAYVHSLTGDPLAWVKAQQAWGRATGEGLNVLEARNVMIESQGLLSYARAYPVELIEAVAAFFALAAVWPITRRFGLAYGIFVASAVLPPLISMGPVSLGRYTAPLFPIFLWLGAAVPEARRPYWIALFAAGQALVATLFFTWRPPY